MYLLLQIPGMEKLKLEYQISPHRNYKMYSFRYNLFSEIQYILNPLPDMPISGFLNSAPNKDTMSKI